MRALAALRRQEGNFYFPLLPFSFLRLPFSFPSEGFWPDFWTDLGGKFLSLGR
jgi:hypothetical protein